MLPLFIANFPLGSPKRVDLMHEVQRSCANREPGLTPHAPDTYVADLLAGSRVPP